MHNLIDKATSNNSNGVIRFYCKENIHTPCPTNYSDPLTLLGDIKILNLNSSQKSELREIIKAELTESCAQEIWKNRTFRKNIILSFGKVV